MYKNVKETFPLFDTMLISQQVNQLSKRPEEWFNSFQAAGAASEWNFFNIRNKASAGLPYNNQDTRDQLAWAYKLTGLTVAFFAPQVALQYRDTNTQQGEILQSALWEACIPRHCGLEFKLNQDIKLEINSMMPGAGCGPIAGGYGVQDPTFTNDVPYKPAFQAGSQSEPSSKNAFYFPTEIGIPRKCAISATIRPNEYARRLLQAMGGPYFYKWNNQTGVEVRKPVAFGIRITLLGSRLVQQRGQLHA